VSAVEQAEFRIMDALWSAQAATERQLRGLASVKKSTCHKALWQLKRAGVIAVVGMAPGVTNRAHVYALVPENAEAYRETPAQARKFARLFRAQHPEGFG
jgi:DNA-binding MarR family transcriptional regulator